MKILLDENIPQKAIIVLPGHNVFSVEEMGWKGKQNSELLTLMGAENFDALVTFDKNLQFQQDLSKFKLLVFLLKAPDNKPSTVRPLFHKLLLHLQNPSQPPALIVIE